MLTEELEIEPDFAEGFVKPKSKKRPQKMLTHHVVFQQNSPNRYGGFAILEEEFQAWQTANPKAVITRTTITPFSRTFWVETYHNCPTEQITEIWYSFLVEYQAPKKRRQPCRSLTKRRETSLFQLEESEGYERPLLPLPVPTERILEEFLPEDDGPGVNGNGQPKRWFARLSSWFL